MKPKTKTKTSSMLSLGALIYIRSIFRGPVILTIVGIIYILYLIMTPSVGNPQLPAGYSTNGGVSIILLYAVFALAYSFISEAVRSSMSWKTIQSQQEIFYYLAMPFSVLYWALLTALWLYSDRFTGPDIISWISWYVVVVSSTVIAHHLGDYITRLRKTI